jgi:hypothetical protein
MAADKVVVKAGNGADNDLIFKKFVGGSAGEAADAANKQSVHR